MVEIHDGALIQIEGGVGVWPNAIGHPAFCVELYHHTDITLAVPLFRGSIEIQLDGKIHFPSTVEDGTYFARIRFVEQG